MKLKRARTRRSWPAPAAAAHLAATDPRPRAGGGTRPPVLWGGGIGVALLVLSIGLIVVARTGGNGGAGPPPSGAAETGVRPTGPPPPAATALPAAASASGVAVTRVAGGLLLPGYAEGPGAAARFRRPGGLAADAAGTLYVADTDNHRIRRITPDGTVSTFAGTGVAGYADGGREAAQFDGPQGLVVDRAGTVYVTDYHNNRIRRVTPDGVVSTVAGSGVAGSADGPGAAAQFAGPYGIALDQSGVLYVTDERNHRVRTIARDGTVGTHAGGGPADSPAGAFADGHGDAARFAHPSGIAVDGTGTVYVADRWNGRVRAITPDGVVSTVPTDTRFVLPRGLALDSRGTLYVTDATELRRLSPDGLAATVASFPMASRLSAVALDAAGEVYIIVGGAIGRVSVPGPN
jgi:sugar lactone lactonase YvrE